MVCIVHLADIGFQSVRNDEIIYMEQEVIHRYLVKDLLGQRYGRCLVLDDKPRPKLSVVQYAVCTYSLFSDLQRDFVGKQGCGIAFIADQIMNEMLRPSASFTLAGEGGRLSRIISKAVLSIYI